MIAFIFFLALLAGNVYVLHLTHGLHDEMKKTSEKFIKDLTALCEIVNKP